jgi:hypothetical protein
MSKERFIEAALMRLRSEIIEHKAVVDTFLEHPLDSIKNETYLTDIVEHMKTLAVCENAYRVVHQAYVTTTVPVEEQQENKKPLVVTPERSPTMKRSLETQKMLSRSKESKTKKKQTLKKKEE